MEDVLDLLEHLMRPFPQKIHTHTISDIVVGNSWILDAHILPSGSLEAAIKNSNSRNDARVQMICQRISVHLGSFLGAEIA